MKTFHHFKLFKHLFILSLIILLSSSSLFAQQIIKGVVKDAGDNQPMMAVTVYIKGTSNGTVTDYNGEYLLNIGKGEQIVEVAYLGYETLTDTIFIEKDQTIELNYELTMASFTGEAVIVTAQARGQLGAVNKQVNSNKIVNVVSAERIKEFPDDNAAQSISRLPGVHLSGSSVVIRGIEPKMNKILINGVEMPSTDANNRTVSLDMISSNMLSGIEVFKTVTPDMDADAVGGVVNLRLQEAPDGMRYSILAQNNFNLQEKANSYKIWADFSNRYLDDKLGLSLNLNYTDNTGGYDDIRTRYGRVTEGTIEGTDYMFNSLTVTDRIDKSTTYGGSVMADFKVGEGKVIVNSMLTDKANNRLTYTDGLDAGLVRRIFTIEHSSYSSLLWNNLVQFDQQIGRVKLNVTASYIKFDRSTDYSYKYLFSPTRASIISDSLTVAKRMEMEPYEIYNYVIDSAWATNRMTGFNWNPENFCENRLSANIDIEIPFTINDWFNLNVKTGGKYKKMYREYDGFDARYGDDIASEDIHEDFSGWLIAQGHENWESALPFAVFRDYGYTTNENFMNGSNYYSMPYVLDVDLMDEMAINLVDHEKLQKTESEFRNDYWGGEHLIAGYIMGELNLWNKLLIIPGVRYESLTYDYSALKVASPAKNVYNVLDTLYKPKTHAHILPHLHARMKVTPWFDVRFSYNKTLTRPDYNYVIPKVFYNTVASSGDAGNPNLKPAESQNLDLSFSFHSDRIGLITVGGFTKSIDGIFYSQTTLLKNLPDSSIIKEFPLEQYPALIYGESDFYINNSNLAELKGVEIEWQSNLSYLPVPFNGLVLNANYTRVWSETLYPLHRVTKEYITEPPYIVDVENDTVFKGSLINQADDIGNISIGYDYKGFSARLSFRYQGNIIGKVNSRNSENGYTDTDYRFDLAIKQQIPLKFAKIEIYFNVVNFTNVPYSTYEIYPNKGATNTRLRYTGRQLQLGLRLKNITR